LDRFRVKKEVKYDQFLKIDLPKLVATQAEIIS
jgi:hypothetical protein